VAGLAISTVNRSKWEWFFFRNADVYEFCRCQFCKWHYLFLAISFLKEKASSSRSHLGRCVGWMYLIRKWQNCFISSRSYGQSDRKSCTSRIKNRFTVFLLSL